MPIYTRKGDQGDTSGPGGRKVRKSDPLCHALGGIDELGAHVGWCVAAACGAEAAPIAAALAPIGSELLTLGAMMAASGSTPAPVAITAQSVARMEAQIDQAMGACEPLTHFIVPGGGELACRLHVARTVCRRAERHIVAAVDAGAIMPEAGLKYVNRLGDLLFALARLAAK